MRVLRFLIAAASFLVTNSALAALIDPCPLGGELPCHPGLPYAGVGNTIASVATNFNSPLVLAFGAFVFAMLVAYGAKILLSNEENSTTEVKTALGHALFGTIIVAGAATIAGSFTNFGTVAVDDSALSLGIFTPMLRFFLASLGIAFIVNLVFQGIRLIVAQDDEQVTKARKRLVQSVFASIVLILSTEIVEAFVTGSTTILPQEVAGIARFFATIFGFLGAVAIIVGGILLVISVNDNLKDQGKKAIIGGFLTLLIVFIAYAIVLVFT